MKRLLQFRGGSVNNTVAELGDPGSYYRSPRFWANPTVVWRYQFASQLITDTVIFQDWGVGAIV